MKPIIEVQNLSKQYKIGQKQTYLSLRESVTNFFKSKKRQTAESDFWALNDVSFNIQAGESIGIIGRNGAGKSTLLKILSRITPPTKGKVILRGRMASLLEVGTGFHPELTGRENVYFNASILGLRKLEVNKKFDEIIAFSGVEQFIDTPLKHYSSGMQLRLAFAVAAHLEPEILVIDEVLAVGDAEFQKKCLGKMDEVSKSGRTVLFVSHNLEQIKRLCPISILLDKGQVLNFDATPNIVSYYLQKNSHYTTEWLSQNHSELAQSLENPFFSLHRLALTNELGHLIDSHIGIATEQIFVQIEGFVKQRSNLLNIGFIVLGIDQTPFFMSYQTDGHEMEGVDIQEGFVRLRASVNLTQLNEGSFSIQFLCGLHCVKMLYADESICVNFNLIGLRGQSHYYTKRRNFLLSPYIKWDILN